MTIGLCLAVAASIVASLPIERFTLDWVHSIEKVHWQEDWRIEPARRTLVLVESRLRGSGAGMEPAEGARLRNGIWHLPGGLEIPRLTLALSGFTEDWQLCSDRGCRPLRGYAPANATAIDLLPCRIGRLPPGG